MKTTVLLATAAALTLAGCNAPPPSKGSQGRYQGIGIASPGELWARITSAEKPSDPKAATTSDDEQLIVVVDSTTGEIRQCGNLSGVCIRMNPWSKDAAAAPVILSEHMIDIQARRDAERQAPVATAKPGAEDSKAR